MPRPLTLASLALLAAAAGCRDEKAEGPKTPAPMPKNSSLRSGPAGGGPGGNQSGNAPAHLPPPAKP